MIILQHPHPLLTTRLEPLEEITEQTSQDAASMLLLCKTMGGLGLAANQVGVTYRMFVIPELAKPTCINPRIVRGKNLIKSIEGCLSLPGYQNVVSRYNNITVEYYNLAGELIKTSLEGTLACVFAHELEHLDGILLNDASKKIKEWS